VASCNGEGAGTWHGSVLVAAWSAGRKTDHRDVHWTVEQSINNELFRLFQVFICSYTEMNAAGTVHIVTGEILAFFVYSEFVQHKSSLDNFFHHRGSDLLLCLVQTSPKRMGILFHIGPKKQGIISMIILVLVTI
jgi:hypothetical protein